MESLSFAPGTNAQNIYNKVMERLWSDEDGVASVDIMFHSAAMRDGNCELSEEEARSVQAVLDKYDRGLLLSLNVDFVRYDSQEIKAAWSDEKGMSRSLTPQSWDYLKTMKNHFAQASIWQFLPLFYSCEEDSLIILDYYRKLANHPKINSSELKIFLGSIADLYLNYYLYDDEGSPKPILAMPDFDTDAYYKYFCPFLEIAARTTHDTFVFWQDNHEDFQSNKNELTYLRQMAYSKNETLVGYALIALGRSQSGKEIIIDVLDEPKNSAVIVGSAFEALSYFRDEATVEFLLGTIQKNSFYYANFARSALVHSAAPDVVVKLLCENLLSDDVFVRGEAASLLKYFIKRPEVAKSYKEIKKRLKTMSRNQQEALLVRATAQETLSYFNKQEIPSVARPQTINVTNVNYKTSFFRYPVQLSWILDKIREKAFKIQDSSEKINVLSIGSSIGVEPLSIMMTLFEDYDNNPRAWGKFDPRKRVKIIASDISYDALRYFKRGLYFKHSLYRFNDVGGFRWYAQVFGKDEKALLEKYFVFNPELDAYSLKETYRNMFDIKKIDITAGDSALNNSAYVVVYNNISQYLPFIDKLLAVDNLLELSQRFVTYVIDPEDKETQKAFEKDTRTLHYDDGLGLREKN